MKDKVYLYLGEELARYGFGDDHPFGPDRMATFWAEAQRRKLDIRVTLQSPANASNEEISRFHGSDYIRRVKRQSRDGRGYLDHGDTPAFVGIYEAAACVVGTTLAAVGSIMEGSCRRAFVPIAGLHHARPDSAAGFCVFNDCGVAIQTLLDLYAIERVAYVDIDAHHGDGIYYTYAGDPRVIIVDLHEDGHYLYPGSGHSHEAGSGTAVGTKLNIPMAPGAETEQFIAAWEQAEAFLEQMQPQFIIFQCGADSIAGDPITHLRYTPACHAHATSRLCAVAERHSDGRLLALGGGGYDRRNLALAWSAVLEHLCDNHRRADE